MCVHLYKQLHVCFPSSQLCDLFPNANCDLQKAADLQAQCSLISNSVVNADNVHLRIFTRCVLNQISDLNKWSKTVQYILNNEAGYQKLSRP